MSGKLYVVATPIGNLKDITLRALEILRSVDIVICEDTRITKNLLSKYEILKPTISFHQHSNEARLEKLINNILSGESAALVTDAGTPGISDPGGKLVEKAHEENISVIPIPGPSAVVALLSVSGLPADRFNFLGFVPHKKGRETFFRNIVVSDKTVVFYESVHRILKTLKVLNEVLAEDKIVVVGRELTKQFEEIKRGSAKEILNFYESHPDKVKGEFVVTISK